MAESIGGPGRLHRGSGNVVVDAQRLCSGGGGAAGSGGDDGDILGLIGCIGLLPVWLEASGPCKLLGFPRAHRQHQSPAPFVFGGLNENQACKLMRANSGLFVASGFCPQSFEVWASRARFGHDAGSNHFLAQVLA